MKWSRIFLLTMMFATIGYNSSGQNIQTLCSFQSTNGANSQAALTMGNDGNFYGTTSTGGQTSIGPWGTMFKVTTNGTLNTLVNFNGTNGANPYSGLTLGNDGYFYGTAWSGGSNSFGTIFKVTTNGALTTLYSFSKTNGSYPTATLTLKNDGYFYGTTSDGGSSNCGTIFKTTTNGTVTTLISFSGTNGQSPYGSLSLGNDGNLYGTTAEGGNGNYGTIFKVTTNGTLTTLFSFGYTNGMNPNGALTLGSDGSFYGTTQRGANYGAGTIFKVTTNGALTVLVSFGGTNVGAYPYAGLTLGNDGNFYGTTTGGGTTSDGTIFEITTNGMFTSLFTFNGTNGANPYCSLILGNDGCFYGTTDTGGSGGVGTVFRFTLAASIITQPSSQTNSAGTTVKFTVIATGQPPVSYQWQKNGSIQSLLDGGNSFGTSSNTLTIIQISDYDVANYSVIVSNSLGVVTSSNATLTVIDPPTITAQPTNQTLMQGGSASFAVSVGGTPPFQYQWKFNNTNILNATNVTYSIPTVVATNSGKYSVVVWNSASFATSSNATLTVIFPPGYNKISSQLLGGGNMQLSFVGIAGGSYALDRSFSLSPANWIPQITNPADGNGNLIITNTPNRSTNNFWRIRSLP